MRVRREFEAGWMRFERSQLTLVNTWPVDPGQFSAWLKGVVIHHPAADHPLFRYIEAEADRRDVIRFVAGEVAVDTRFDDVLALVQVGMQSARKMELAANYWDEMGNGDIGDVHTHMFGALLEELGSAEIAS